MSASIKRLGKSGLKVSDVIVGTMQFGVKTWLRIVLKMKSNVSRF